MKFFPLKFSIVFLLMGAFTWVGCDKDENDEPQEEINFTSEDSERAAKMDNVAEGTFNIIEQAFAENEIGGPGTTMVSLFPQCTEITVGIQGNVFTIRLDFGTACTLNNDNVVSGSIVLEYGPLVAGTYTVTYSFENFVFNDNGVSGGGEILYEIANQNDNPQSTVNESIMVSFANTTVTGTRNGLRVSEWVEGVGSGNWMDNVYHVTGNWQTQFTNGFERTGEVTEMLVRKLSCRFLVSGVLEVTQDGITAAIDFGDGECDNQAVFIYNGEEYPFIMN